jgi:hypothetical protein
MYTTFFREQAHPASKGCAPVGYSLTQAWISRSASEDAKSNTMWFVAPVQRELLDARCEGNGHNFRQQWNLSALDLMPSDEQIVHTLLRVW